MIITILLAIVITLCAYYYLPARYFQGLTFYQQVGVVTLVVLLCFMIPRLIGFSFRLFLGLLLSALLYLAYLYFTNPQFAEGLQEWLDK